MAKQVSSYLGYSIEFEHISYQCPEWRIYGFRDEAGVRAEIRKKIKAHEAKAANLGRPAGQGMTPEARAWLGIS